ncbi:hypothetical protein [Haloarchaeobius salinus]|uniref:hypothetical protein n=1 Tax=Haloarchaeobius salinus TaxID=1198298 RepID=UPI002108EA73|nr:hypothetical protein [Haloarchaeobius salinus]
MNRRSVVAAGFSSLSAVGLSGCLWNTGGTSKIRLESERMTQSDVCSWPLKAVENVDRRHIDPVEEAIETGNATGDYAFEEALFVSSETNYFYIDITITGDDEAEYSVEHAFDTQERFCEFTLDRLVHSVDPVSVDIEVLETLRTTIRDGTFESEPPSDAAEATVEYLRNTVGTLFEDEFFVELDDQYYHIHYHWESGE